MPALMAYYFTDPTCSLLKPWSGTPDQAKDGSHIAHDATKLGYAKRISYHVTESPAPSLCGKHAKFETSATTLPCSGNIHGHVTCCLLLQRQSLLTKERATLCTCHCAACTVPFDKEMRISRSSCIPV